MDCVSGELLIYRVRRCREIDKEVLLGWFRKLIVQIEQYHRCQNNRCYRYVNPYSVLITEEDDVFLLDLEAESNLFVLKSMQKRAMRDHFVKPIIHIKESTKLSLDLYGYGKTIQFVLASMNVTPALTRWEEYRLAKIIEKCLDENPKKQYENLKQVEKELPSVRKGGERKFRKRSMIVMGLLLAGVVSFTLFYRREDKNEQKNEIQTETEEYTENKKQTEGKKETESAETDTENISEEYESNGPTDGLDSAKETVNVIEQYLLRNTVKDNREVIREGEVLRRDVLRYLAAAYDREGLKEQAIQTYEMLCRVENQPDYLETAYLRKIVLEREIYPGEMDAVSTGNEAVERFPESEELAQKYAEAVWESAELSEEEKTEIIEPLAEKFVVIKESEYYKKRETEEQSEKQSEESEKTEESEEQSP